MGRILPYVWHPITCGSATAKSGRKIVPFRRESKAKDRGVVSVDLRTSVIKALARLGAQMNPRFNVARFLHTVRTSTNPGTNVRHPYRTR